MIWCVFCRRFRYSIALAFRWVRLSARQFHLGSLGWGNSVRGAATAFRLTIGRATFLLFRPATRTCPMRLLIILMTANFGSISSKNYKIIEPDMSCLGYLTHFRPKLEKYAWFWLGIFARSIITVTVHVFDSFFCTFYIFAQSWFSYFHSGLFPRYQEVKSLGAFW